MGGLPFLGRFLGRFIPGGRPNPFPPASPLDIFFNSAKMSSSSSTFLLSRDSLSIPEVMSPPSALVITAFAAVFLAGVILLVSVSLLSATVASVTAPKAAA